MPQIETDAIVLEVRESNFGARSMYASRGFEEVGRRRDYYDDPREDALVLRSDIGHWSRDGIPGER